jgi:hypothetical protein
MKLLLPDAVKSLQPQAMSPLEERLRGANPAQARKETLSQLAELEQRTRVSMAAGVVPERYRELAALLDASLAAHEVLAHFSPPPPPAGSSLPHQGQERK